MLRMLLPLVASMLMNGGLQKILGRLQQSGSTKGSRGSRPGRTSRLTRTTSRRPSTSESWPRSQQRLGVSEDEAAEAVAQVLPDVVDQATPDGELPDEDELDRKFGRLHELDGVDKG